MKNDNDPRAAYKELRLPTPIHRRLKAQAAITGMDMPELAAQILDKALPKLKPAAAKERT